MKSTEVYDTCKAVASSTVLETHLYSEVFFVITVTASSTYSIRVSDDNTNWTYAPEADLISSRRGSEAGTFKVAYIGNKEYIKIEVTDPSKAVAIGCGAIHTE